MKQLTTQSVSQSIKHVWYTCVAAVTL